MVTKIEFYNCLVASTANATLSRLWVRTWEGDTYKQKGICWILEDGIRGSKIWGETAIPEGPSDVVPVFAPSKFYLQANKNWGHEFAVGLDNVPNFEAIRVHWGTTIKDTYGCPLTGIGVNYDGETHCWTISRSREAYTTRFYPILEKVYDRTTKKFKVPVKWYTLRNNLLEVNLK